VRLVANDAETSSLQGDDEQMPLYALDVLSPAQALRDFLVFGRFEVHDPDNPLATHLTLGQQLRATDITDNCQPDVIITDNRARDVIWVAGQLATSESALALADAGHPARVFVLNEGDGESHHWEYDWRSGTSQRMRASQHKFCAYVFLPDAGDASVWQVVAVAASTPFTLKSYRKQDDDEYESNSAGDATPSLVPVPAVAVGIIDEGPSPSAAAVAMAARPVNEVVLLRQNPLVVKATNKLAVIMNLLAAIDVSWIAGDVLTNHVVAILRSYPDTPAAAFMFYTDDALRQYATRCVIPLLTALRAVSPHARSDAWRTRWSGLLKLCIDLFCVLVQNGTLAELQTLVRRAARIPTANGVAVVEAFGSLVLTFERHVAEIVPQLREYESLESIESLEPLQPLELLVDNIVSSMYADYPDLDGVSRYVRVEGRRLLRNTSLLGLHPYREQLRLWSAALPDPPFQYPLPSDVSRLFSGMWTCVSVDPSASRALPPAPMDYGFSAFAAIQLLVAGHRIELAMNGDATELRVRSAWSCFADLWSVYVLDGEQHPLSVLPHGLGSVLWQHLGAGTIVGDYCGRCGHADDGTIVLDLDSFVYSSGDAPSYLLQLRVVPTATDSSIQLDVYARLYRSRLVADPRAMAAEELAVLAPAELRSRVDFAAEDLVVAATLVYEQTP
jgi:hypothetical protein